MVWSAEARPSISERTSTCCDAVRKTLAIISWQVGSYCWTTGRQWHMQFIAALEKNSGHWLWAGHSWWQLLITAIRLRVTVHQRTAVNGRSLGAFVNNMAADRSPCAFNNFPETTAPRQQPIYAKTQYLLLACHVSGSKLLANHFYRKFITLQRNITTFTNSVNKLFAYWPFTGD